MAGRGDVEMADAERISAAPRTQDVLHAITTGRIDALASFASSAGSQNPVEASGLGIDADLERDLLAPFLPLLTRIHASRRSSPAFVASLSPLTSLLNRYDHVNELCEYTDALQSLTLADVQGFATETTDATPVYRQFEGADARDRACIVLGLVLAFRDGSLSKDALHEHELVRNEIYKPHLTAILVNALAVDALLAGPGDAQRGGESVTNVVQFCLAVPLGVDLIEAIVLNDPSSFGHVLDAVVRSIHQCNPLQSSSSSASDPSGAASVLAGASASSLLPFELRQAQAACLALATLSHSYATQIVYRLRAAVSSVAAAFVAFQLLVELPRLRGDDHFYASFVYQWMRLSAAEKTASTSALHVFLQASLSREGEAQSEQDKIQSGQATVTASFLEEARYVMSQFRQFLIEDMVQFRLTPSGDGNPPSRFAFVEMLNVLIGFLVIGRLHPEDHEATQLLKLFDKVTKEIPQLQPSVSAKNFERMISLMFVLLLLLCSPSAPAFAKMPSQREDSTKLVLQRAQQSVYSLYNTKAACPLFIMSSVLLYTKSPSLLPFLNSFLGDTFPMTGASVRVEHLYGVGDAILKPILTENVMAREVLTAFEPSKNVSGKDQDAMEEMVLRSIHGLLTEKSYLRHHHARKLEEWITLLLERAATPIHPLIVSILLEWIENYVMAFEYPLSQRPLLQLAVIPLSSAFLHRTLSHAALASRFSSANQQIWARATLVLIYALQFNQRLRVASAIPGTKLSAFANQGNGDSADQLTTQPLRGSAEILLSYDLDAYPLKNILAQTAPLSTVGGLFEFAAPTLCRLMAEEYPRLLVENTIPGKRSNDTLHSVALKHKLLFVSADEARSTQGEFPVVSWNSACMWLRDLHSARSAEIEEAFRLCVSALLPHAVLSLQHAATEEVGPSAFVAVFTDCYNFHIRQDIADPTQLDTRLVEALCMPQQVWRHFEKTSARQGATVVAGVTTLPTPTWIGRDQLIEQPFYAIQNAHTGVLSSPSLLRLALSLVMSFREDCIFQLRRRESIGLVAKKALQANDSANGSAVALPALASDPATQQFLMIQDCILVQSMLGLVAKVTVSGPRHERDECVHTLYKVMDELLADTKAGVTSSAQTSSPPLALLINSQGYDPSLIASFVDQVPSLKQLWLHWMHQPSVESANSKSSSDRRGGSSHTPSHLATKAIADFVSDSATEKDLIKWQFRVRVFFKLCEKYFTSPAHSTPAMQTIKQILNRLRGIAVSSSGSNKGVLHAMSIGDNTARVAFVEIVLNDAIDGCGPHPELRCEIAQFLLNLKKHVGSLSTQSNAAVTSPSSVESGAPRSRDHHQDLERVVFRAYQKILQLV